MACLPDPRAYQGNDPVERLVALELAHLSADLSSITDREVFLVAVVLDAKGEAASAVACHPPKPTLAHAAVAAEGLAKVIALYRRIKGG